MKMIQETIITGSAGLAIQSDSADSKTQNGDKE